MKDDKKPTPMLQKYLDMKENYKDEIVFYRLGDFYEMFYEDAELASRELELTLTSRGGAPMCGIPHHAAEVYIARLIAKGYKVAVCEQLTEPKPGQIVERDVVRVITPGTVTEDIMLDEKKNNYILCLYRDEDSIAVCYADITTGDFRVQNIESDDKIKDLTDVLTRILPTEVIGNVYGKALYESLPIMNLGILPRFNSYYDWAFSSDRCVKNLRAQFGDNYAKVFDMQNFKAGNLASGALIEYLNETQKRVLKNINKIKIVRNQDYLMLDSNTRRNLELTESIRERKRYGSLIWLMDKTKTSMGGRRFRQMFDEPLRDVKKINKRLDMVEEVVKKIVVRDRLSEQLIKISDIERLSGKIAYGNINPKELISLKKSLYALPEIKEILNGTQKLNSFNEDIGDFREVADLLERAIKLDPPTLLRDGGYIADGFNQELDEYRNIKESAKKWIINLQESEREKTGISSLKVDHNKIIGYFIEVNKKDALKVPLSYERRQTVANNERYINEDLKEIQAKVDYSLENSLKLEAKLYGAIKDTLLRYVEEFQKTAKALAEIDCIVSLASVAVKNGYVRPTVTNNSTIKIIEGRHPVVESFLKGGEFISNDTSLNNYDEKTMIITGPNMAGKSTYMRQVALITFMAHLGSYVPAKSAEICVCDRIFTRVGASDDLAFGQSTFMVEMSEVANILANATNQSLIILDEIGRGTSTFDGLSIAWAVVEHISKHMNAKTLFATHYHELTELEGVLDGVKNYKIAVKEYNDNVIFLHKIVRGGANKSFGIEVARLAGVAKPVLDRAKEISNNLEKLNKKLDLDIFKEDRSKAEDNIKVAQSILSIVKDVDMNRISPMTAFDILADLVKRAKEE